MTMVQVLMFLWVVAPGSTVFVKGHSHAADKVRENIATLTCYTPGAPERSAAILQVDHLLEQSGGRSWVVMVLSDSQHHVLYERKVEENPWPLQSSWNRLLKDMAKSTCGGYQNLPAQKTYVPQHPAEPAPSPVPKAALAQQSAK